MKKDKKRKLKQLFIQIYGRPPKKPQYDSKGRLIQVDEFKEFKKQYSTKV